MYKAAPLPTPYEIGTECPGLEAGSGYANDFTAGALIASAIDEKWALYSLSSRLDILVTRLQSNIYAVVAFPRKGFQKAKAGEYKRLAPFRGWLLQYFTHPQKWILLAASQEVGKNEFIRLRRKIIAG
ncbi:hypothetical protein ES703_117225 [subsurface metagenome]